MATKAIVGEKVGMTQVWGDDNRVIPVTVLKVSPARIVQVKTTERDGYTALQVTYGRKDARKLTKPEAGHFAGGCRGRHKLVELRLDDIDGYSVGDELKVDLLEAGERVDVTAVSRGKGFAGVMKRHNFGGQKASHGTHGVHRMPGSIGQCSTPGRVSGHEDGRPHGQREGHDAEPRGRRGGCRARPAAREGLRARSDRGSRARTQRRQGRGEEVAMATVTVRTPAGAEAGTSSSRTRSSACSPTSRDASSGHRPARDPPCGHPEHEDPSRGARRRREAVPPEGHRPGPRRLDPCAALEWRWRRPRPEAAQLRPAHPQEDDPPGAALGAVAIGHPRARSSSSTDGDGTARRLRARRLRSRRSASMAGSSWC